MLKIQLTTVIAIHITHDHFQLIKLGENFVVNCKP